MVRRLTRILYMNMDNVSTRAWRAQRRAIELEVSSNCHLGVPGGSEFAPIGVRPSSNSKKINAGENDHPSSVNEVERFVRPREIACTATVASY